MRCPGIVFALLAATALVAGCSLPRGAALSSEVLREQSAEQPTFAVVAVNRANTDQIAKWPQTGWAGGYSWLEGGRGPVSTVLRAGDTVNVVIWDNEENSLLASPGQKSVTMEGLTVSPSGSLFLPYVGEVVVNGLTPDQARRSIQESLTMVVPQGQVVLTSEAGTQNSVDVVSGVRNPGNFPLRSRNFTVLGAIAQGGGIAPDLRNPIVRLIRDGKTYEIRSDQLLSNASFDTLLRGGDKVLVEEDKRYFTALGAAGNESLIYFETDKVSALEAMSMIGGLSDNRADPKGVLVLREYPQQAVRPDGRGPSMPQVVFTFDLTSADGLFAARNFQINPKDTVLATESPVVAARTVLGLVGQVFGIRNAATND